MSALAGAWAAGTFQPLNLKPGLWEITLTVRTAGAPPMPPELLDRLTPEQRARMQATTNSGRQKQTTVKTSCLTAQELQQPLMLGFGDPQNCRTSLLNSTSALQELRVDCGKSLSMGSGAIKIEPSDPEHAKVVSQWSGTDGSRTVTVTSDATLKWLGADCSGHPAPAPPPPAPSTVNYYKLGKEQSDRGDFPAALQSLNKAVQQYPRDAIAFNARGYVYLRIQNLPAAIADFSEAIRLRPDYRNAYQNRAIARRRAGDVKGAEEDERKATELKGHP